ncbi:MAG: DMT family transporter [Acidimicrobiia bacterium]
MRNRIGATGLLTTFATWSLANVSATRGHFGATAIFYQSVFMFVVFALITKRKEIKLSFQEAKKVLPHATFRVIGLCLITVSFLYVKVGVVDTIIACNIFLIVCILAPSQGEKFNSKVLIPLTTSIVGVFLICRQATSGQNIFDVKMLLPIGAMIALGFSVFNWRKCSKDIEPSKYLCYMHGWVGIFSTPIIILFKTIGLANGGYTPNKTQFIFMCLSMLLGTLGDVIFSRSQKYSSYTMNALLAPSSVVFSGFFGWLFVDQSLSTIQILGMGLVLLSVVGANYINVQIKPVTSFEEELENEIIPEPYVPNSPKPNIAAA